VAASVLQALLKLDPANHVNEIVQLQRQAARISTNRVIAGVHFPVDSIAGRSLGQALGEYFVCRAATVAPTEAYEYLFDGTASAFEAGPVEFHPGRQPLSGGEGQIKAPFYLRTRVKSVPRASCLLQHMWAKAEAEWNGKFGL
jgi:hypothetical protein